VGHDLQVGPILVDPGGKFAMKQNDYQRLNRSAICLTKDDVVIVTLFGGISLYDFAELFASSPKDGGFGCDSALNLDGGPSTQVSFSDGSASFEQVGRWRISNAIVIQSNR
jgi:uncharacterized protein YigE (DUF2233 family)